MTTKELRDLADFVKNSRPIYSDILITDSLEERNEKHKAQDELRTKAVHLILSLTPRTEPPTVEELKDDDLCFVYDCGMGSWNVRTGAWVRELWFPNLSNYTNLSHWLPITALPTPTEAEG